MDQWLKTRSLKRTLKKYEGNKSVSVNGDEECSDMTVQTSVKAKLMDHL
jgi:hypothetical protein